MDGGNNTVSVGSSKNTRRIVNVSDARLTASSADSVIDMSNATGARVVTGIATNLADTTSAANVGYVQQTALHIDVDLED